MSLWLIMLILMAIKVPLAALMLWLPFRDDDAVANVTGPADDDGGSPALPAGPLNPHPRPTSPRAFPRLPRRGPHGCPAPPSPRRVRTVAVGTRRARTFR